MSPSYWTRQVHDRVYAAIHISNPEPAEWIPPVVKGKANKARNGKKKPA